MKELEWCKTEENVALITIFYQVGPSVRQMENYMEFSDAQK